MDSSVCVRVSVKGTSSECNAEIRHQLVSAQIEIWTVIPIIDVQNRSQGGFRLWREP